MKKINSIERVEAALNFANPDRVPTWGGNLASNLGFDIYSMVMLPPKEWRPGWSEEEKELFPHVKLKVAAPPATAILYVFVNAL